MLLLQVNDRIIPVCLGPFILHLDRRGVHRSSRRVSFVPSHEKILLLLHMNLFVHALSPKGRSAHVAPACIPPATVAPTADATGGRGVAGAPASVALAGVIMPDRDLSGSNVCPLMDSKTRTKDRSALDSKSREYNTAAPCTLVACLARMARCSCEMPGLEHHDNPVAFIEWVVIFRPAIGLPPVAKILLRKAFNS